jgi:hypothetical protein
VDVKTSYGVSDAFRKTEDDLEQEDIDLELVDGRARPDVQG